MDSFELLIDFCFWTLTAAILLTLYRLAKGPHLIDRILALDMIAICVVGMVVLLSIQWDSEFFIELVLIFSLLGFVTAVAFVFIIQMLDRRDPATGSEDPKERPDK